MKNLLARVFVFVITALCAVSCGYAFCAFTVWEMNPAKWTSDLRFVCALFSLFSVGALGAVTTYLYVELTNNQSK